MIDTLKFARRMTDAGMDAKVAERLAEEFDDALKQSDLATKADLKVAVAEIKGDLTAEIAKSRSQVIVAVAVLVFLGQIAPAVVTLIRAAAHP